MHILVIICNYLGYIFIMRISLYWVTLSIAPRLSVRLYVLHCMWLKNGKNVVRSSSTRVPMTEVIGVGAQSTLGGYKNFARKICIKNKQNARILNDSCPKNYQNTWIFIFARKIYKMPEFLHDFPRKMPWFYILLARKIFFRNFRGGGTCPPSPHLLRLWQKLTALHFLIRGQSSTYE